MDPVPRNPIDESSEPDADDGLEAVEPLAEEFLARLRKGERPTVEEFVDRHPNLAGPIRDVLSALVLVEHLKPRSAESLGHPVGELLASGGRPVERLGDYRILRELGRGGMGIVYEAEQESLGRRVALKVLAPWVSDNPQTILRFNREARSAAQLHHTNIVPVFGVGEHEGLHYYAMQFICGAGLDQVLEEVRRIRRLSDSASPDQDAGDSPRRRFAHAHAHDASATVVSELLVTGEFVPRGSASDDSRLVDGEGAIRAAPSSPSTASPVGATMPGGSDLTSSGDAARNYERSVARIGVQAAEALEYAHLQGMLHRDIKPSNLLLDAHGTIWVTDFGLAKAAEDDDLTRTGDLVGTLRYMAPERYRGRCDARSDIYALGLVLYELLALRPAFEASDRNRLIHQITQSEPPRLRKLAPKIPRDLETVVHKAIERDAVDRYQTASLLADDLRNWLAQKPIRARPSSPAERLVKWSRRNPILACLVVTIMLTGTGLVAAALIGYVEVARGLRRERQTSYFQRIALAERAWSGADVGRAEELLDGCRPELRCWEWHYLKRLCHADLMTLQVHSGLQPNPLAFNRDGSRLATAGEGGLVTIRDGVTGEPIRTLRGHPGGVYGLAFSPDGTRLATAGHDGTIQLWDFATARPLYAEPPRHPEEAVGVAFSPDGERIVSCSGTFWEIDGQTESRGELVIRDAATGRVLLELRGHTGAVHQALFSPDGTLVASAGGDGTVKIWNATTGAVVKDLAAHSGVVMSVAFSPDGQLLASAGLDGVLHVWDMMTYGSRLTIREVDEHFLTVAFSPDGRRVAAGGWGWAVTVWDALDGDRLLTYRGQDREVTGLAFSPDGLRLVAAGFGGIVKVWDASREQQSVTVRGQGGAVVAVALDPDGRRLATVEQEGAVSLIDAASGQELPVPDTLSGTSASVAIGPDGSSIAVGDRRSGGVVVWDATTRRILQSYRGHQGIVSAVAFSSDGRLLASGGSDGALNVWDRSTGRLRFSVPRAPVAITGLAFSPDGEKVAASTGDRATIGVPGEVTVRAVQTGQVLLRLRGHRGGISDLAYSPDGRTLATASWDRTVRVWEATSGQGIHTFKIRGLVVWAVAFSPDGRRLFAADNIGRLTLWDAESGLEVLSLRAHTDRIYDLAFSGDGRLLASACRDATARVWDATPLGHSGTGVPAR